MMTDLRIFQQGLDQFNPFHKTCLEHWSASQSDHEKQVLEPGCGADDAVRDVQHCPV